MTLPDFVANRRTWDVCTQGKIKEAFDSDPDAMHKALDTRYPVSVVGAVKELQARGFAVSQEKLHLYCDMSKLARMGRNFLFYPADIDAAAELLAEANKFSGLALQRRNAGISFAEEWVAIENARTKKYVKAAKAIKVTVGKLRAAIRAGLPDPVTTGVLDVEAAKAWFEANKKNPAFREEYKLETL